MTDWQPHEQLSGGSSPAEYWREPMVDASNGSNPTEEHVGKHLLSGGLKPDDVEPDPQAIMAERDLLKQRVAELEAENERLRAALMPLETSSLAYVVQEAAAATMQRDQLQAALKLERRAVGKLVDALVMGGACMLGYDHASLSDCSRSTNCRACWARLARKRAREDAGGAR